MPPALHELISESKRTPRDWRTAKQQLLDDLRPLGDVSCGILPGDGSAFGIQHDREGMAVRAAQSDRRMARA